MAQVQMPWGAWYSKEPITLEFPDDWKLEVCRMVGGDDIGDA